MKKLLFLAVCAVMILSMAACGTAVPTATTAPTAAPAATEAGTEAPPPTASEPITVKYVIPGALGPDEDKVMEVLNQKLADDGVGIKLVREAIDWGVWEDKLNLKFTSNEEFDMFHIMQDWITYNNYYSRGALVDVTDLIAQYGPVIKEKIPAEMLDGSRINGKNYIIPTYWIDLGIDSYIMYRTDVFQKYNLQVPKTAEDILSAYRTVRADWNGVNKPILNFSQPTYDAAVLQMTKIHRLYDDFPFIVKDQFFQVFQDGTVKSWFESEDFKKDCAFMNAAYKDGIIQPDVLSVNFDWVNKFNANGDQFLWTVTSMENCKKNNPDIKVQDEQMFILAPDKPIIRAWGVKNANGVSVTSKHPEGPVMFINWLWGKQENWDLYAYGIEGTHWQKDPNNPRGRKLLPNPETKNMDYYNGADWMIGQIDLERYDTDGFLDYNELAYKPIANAQNSVAGTFLFDAKTNVATEYANLQAEAKTVMTPIVMGVQDYETYFPAALARLKAAGLDKVLAEYQTQLTAHIAQTK